MFSKSVRNFLVFSLFCGFCISNINAQQGFYKDWYIENNQNLIGSIVLKNKTVVAYTSKIIIGFSSETGETLWQYNLKTPNNMDYIENGFDKLIPLKKGGFVALSNSKQGLQGFAQAGAHTELLFFDKKGKFLKSKIYDLFLAKTYDIVETNKNDLFLLTRFDGFDHSNQMGTHIIHLNSKGDTLSTKYYKEAIQNGGQLVYTKNREIWAVWESFEIFKGDIDADQEGHIPNITVMAMNEKGQVKWTKRYSRHGDGRPYPLNVKAAVADNSGGAIIGYKNEMMANGLLRINAVGDITHARGVGNIAEMQRFADNQILIITKIQQPIIVADTVNATLLDGAFYKIGQSNYHYPIECNNFDYDIINDNLAATLPFRSNIPISAPMQGRSTMDMQAISSVFYDKKKPYIRISTALTGHNNLNHYSISCKTSKMRLPQIQDTVVENYALNAPLSFLKIKSVTLKNYRIKGYSLKLGEKNDILDTKKTIIKEIDWSIKKADDFDMNRLTVHEGLTSIPNYAIVLDTFIKTANNLIGYNSPYYGHYSNTKPVRVNIDSLNKAQKRRADYLHRLRKPGDVLLVEPHFVPDVRDEQEILNSLYAGFSKDMVKAFFRIDFFSCTENYAVIEVKVSAQPLAYRAFIWNINGESNEHTKILVQNIIEHPNFYDKTLLLTRTQATILANITEQRLSHFSESKEYPRRLNLTKDKEWTYLIPTHDCEALENGVYKIVIDHDTKTANFLRGGTPSHCYGGAVRITVD